MAKRKQPTFADYLVIAITPALIMLLVGSLVFFLLAAFYDGQYQVRLRYIFALFVFAAVLIGRISIEEGKDQATLYSFPLGGATFLTVGQFTQASSVFTVLIIAIIWWSAHKLTWDCTVIDEAEEAESQGLLQSAGLESEEASDLSNDQTLERDTVDEEAQDEPRNWSNLWQRWVADRKRPHAPGIWVIYFALATLPLFGIGQWAIPASDLDTRRAAFHCLLVYVASAMALLGTTSFLGLRRYLRQRKLEMPTEMALTWAGSAAAIVIAILIVASFLPRPRPEYSITDVIGSPEKDRASRFSFFKDDGVDAEDAEQNQQGSQQQSDEVNNEPSDRTSSAKDGRRKTAGKSEEKGDGQKGDSGEDSSSRGDQQNESSDQQPTPQNKPNQESDSQSGRDGQQDRQNNRDENSSGENPTDDQNTEGNQQSEKTPESRQDDSQAQAENEATSRQDPSRKPGRTPQSILRRMTDGLAGLLKLLYWLVVIVVVGYFVYRYWNAILQALRRFWADLAALFGREKPVELAEETESVSGPSRRPFSSYQNPFHSGKKLNDRDLVRYTFLALEAWAHEHQCGRGVDETPFEFARRLGRKFPAIGEAASYVVQLYDRLAYASSAPRLSRERVGQLWQTMGQ